MFALQRYVHNLLFEEDVKCNNKFKRSSRASTVAETKMVPTGMDGCNTRSWTTKGI
jgi:hypothetical protein